MSDHLADFQKLIDVLESLLAPGGCEWDRKQTHQSLVPYLLEETHEVIEAIEFEVPEKSSYAKFPNPASRYALVGVYVAKLKKELKGLRWKKDKKVVNQKIKN